MRKTLLVIFFLQLFLSVSAQSIVVNNNTSPESILTAEELVKEVLLDGGTCSTISNFQLKDNPDAQFPSSDRSWGFFNKGTVSSFPFDRGVVLTTGFAENAEGPDDGIESQGGSGWSGDPQLSALAGVNTNNATIFEFDFIPQGNEISFKYIFASEEYPRYACSDYNDVFAFIISGPGIVNDPGFDGKNIALLPNGLPVTINNVNGSSYNPGDYGFCGEDTYYVDGPFQNIEYGGRTLPLTAFSEVQPGQTYHIRLMIADSNDMSYDSAVFFEAGSFNLGSTIVDENGVDLGENLTICGEENYTLYVNADLPEYQLQWYLNNVAIEGATTNSLQITESGLYKIVVINGDCEASDEIQVNFVDFETNGTSFNLEKIDIDEDGVENFDLTEVQPQIVADPAQYTFSYFHSLEEAQNQNNPIENPTTYQGHDNEIIYIGLASSDGCYKVVKLTLHLILDCIPAQPMCANEEYGTNVPSVTGGAIAEDGPDYGCLTTYPNPTWFYFRIQDPGNLIFHLNQYAEPDQQGEGNDIDFIIWGPFDEVPCDYEDLSTDKIIDCSYSPDEEEIVTINGAETGEYYVLLITNYSQDPGYFNLFLDNDQSTGTFDCTILGETNYALCDDDLDGQVEFDLAQIAEDITVDNPDYSITFYETEEDATDDTGNNIIPTEPFTVMTANSPLIIYAQAKDENGEVQEIYSITLSVYEGVVGAQDGLLEICDVGGDNVEIIDLTSIDVIANPENYIIHYYETEQEAINGDANFIPDPVNFSTGSTTVYVRIENQNGCFDVVKIEINFSDLSVDLGEDFSMCVGEFTLTANGNFSAYTDVTYTWTRNGQIIEGENSNTLVVNETGTYTVKVDTAEGCTGSDSVTVTDGEASTITAITVGPDYVIIDATGGVQPYQYSLTGVVWQDSNQFNYLQPGIYTVYVKTDEGCITTDQFAVFNIPTMFTPNGDGINDTWNIAGMEIYQGSDVVIYDRTGRLVYQTKLESNVIWNGYFMNGQKAPTQDYWYIINVTDGRKFTGHITVKSRGEKN